MSILERGRYVARVATGAADLEATLRLRTRCFRQGHGNDGDRFDAACQHVLLEDTSHGALVGSFRLLTLDAARIGDSYSAQFYGLEALADFPGRIAELGRFCIAPGLCDPDILRVAWGAITRMVDGSDVRLLFGCSSFQGTDPDDFRETFALLAARHLAPPALRPAVRAARIHRFGETGMRANVRRAAQATPPLLRTYLLMGGWVSDHAVIDPELGTLHVFTGLEIGKVPPTRARLLRAVAGPDRGQSVCAQSASQDVPR